MRAHIRDLKAPAELSSFTADDTNKEKQRCSSQCPFPQIVLIFQVPVPEPFLDRPRLESYVPRDFKIMRMTTTRMFVISSEFERSCKCQR